MLQALTGRGSSEAEQRQAIEQANCTSEAPRGRLMCWLCKCQKREEFVVVGWTDPEGARPWLGALLLAYSDPQKSFLDEHSD
jgi:hypothetical protein